MSIEIGIRKDLSWAEKGLWARLMDVLTSDEKLSYSYLKTISKTEYELQTALADLEIKGMIVKEQGTGENNTLENLKYFIP